MRLISIASLFAAVAPVSAHGLGDFPSCAHRCLVTSFPLSGCKSASDIKCLCNQNGRFYKSSKPCIDKKCKGGDMAKAQKAFAAICHERDL
ncbi:hypothetical protein FRB94_005410 [Tulasnella sp. JGI-2019a]|nr:hypothetical protein FRB93_008128 [Tulasnella sp. JGI-2019a]KAG9000440.1 hypothetical protein FRB94_005410 [Tulasnella sp. JGI-2019a]KAG9028500.1 hypothetical protein FRB95_006401 [Tulasnella sp. JGI-2019a]